MAQAAKWTDFSGLDMERLAAIATHRLPAIVSAVLVVLLGWQLARLVWLLVPGSGTGDLVAASPVDAPHQSPAVVADVNRIADAHLFGVADAQDEMVVPIATPTEDLEDTRLALTLKGTMAGSDNRLTVAIIADNRNEEKIYTIGDAVAPGAILHAVYRDQVVLSRSGVLEALRLPKELPASATPPRTTASTTRTVDVSAPTENTIQTAITENAAKLADVIRPTPYFQGGQQMGYRVYPGRDRRQFAALGLRPGDLIKDIDGQSLTDPQQAMQIFQNLGSAEQVSVTVERNGQAQVLVLTTSQLELGESEQ